MTTKEAFLKDVDRHVIEIIRDDGISRHIRFRRPGTMCMHFDLITWPGYLCYTGDMGTYVFSRLDDMFQFFRKEPSQSIDFRYWAEKLQAVNSSGGKGSATEFDSDRFKQVINDYRLTWIQEAHSYGSLDVDQRRSLWDAVDDEVLGSFMDGDDEQSCFQRANDFSWSKGRYLPGTYPVYRFDDLWDHRFTEYTHHFLWCCYAIAWGIRKYDESKA